MLFSGIDLHQRSLGIHALDAEGAATREAELRSDRAAVLAYFGTRAGPHRAAVECAQSWYWLRDLLAPAGVDLRLAHAKYVKAISCAKVKTGRVDARMLAQLLRVGLIPEAHMIGAEHRETRDLLRSRLQLVTRAVRCQHAVGSLLEKYNVAAPAELPELARVQAALQDEQRTLLRTHIKRVGATLKQRRLPTPDVQRLVWVPGIGKPGAYAPVLEIDDVTRFPTVRHFHSYCRLVPGADNSAGKTRHKRSRDGNRYVKQVFHTAAIRAAPYHPEIRGEYRRLARRKGKVVARALIARESASIAYWVLRKQEAFNGRFRGHVRPPKPAAWPRLASPSSLTDAPRASHERMNGRPAAVPESRSEPRR